MGLRFVCFPSERILLSYIAGRVFEKTAPQPFSAMKSERSALFYQKHKTKQNETPTLPFPPLPLPLPSLS